MRIRTVRAITLQIPLDRPVIVGGGMRISEREYLLVVLSTDGGQTGIGWSFTRGAGLAGIVRDDLQPLLEGADALETERLWEKMHLAARRAERRDAAMRSLSALDIALWDLKGQIAGLSLHTMLGGYRAEVPVLMAGMYYTEGRRPDDDAREAAGYVTQGFRAIKIMGGVAPFDVDLARVRAVRRAVGPDARLGLDVNGAWADHTIALERARALADVDVAFIEEPMPTENLAGLRALVAGSPIPIAVGEKETSRQALRDIMIGGAHILRPDATVMGGVSEWVKVHAMASTWGLRVIPHYFPYVHIHMAAALADVEAVEFVTTTGGISNFHRIVRNPLRPSGGVVRAPSGPGLGLELDWDAVERFAVERYARG